RENMTDYLKVAVQKFSILIEPPNNQGGGATSTVKGAKSSPVEGWLILELEGKASKVKIRLARVLKQLAVVCPDASKLADLSKALDPLNTRLVCYIPVNGTPGISVALVPKTHEFEREMVEC